MIEESRKYIEVLRKYDFAASERCRASKAIDSSDIKAHGKSIPFSYVPLFINNDDLAFFQKSTDILYSILKKVTKQYIENPEYRKIFGFSKKLEELILLPCNYSEIIPVGRNDFFFDTETKAYSFCEFNTDGTGGMSRDREITKEILETFPDQDFIKNEGLHGFDTIDKIASNLISVYRSSTIAVKKPLFAIVDWKEEGVMSDFDRFISSFIRQGVECRFTDMRDLVFDGKNLVDKNDGRVINGIYRRAVTSVILSRLSDCKGLIEAVRNNAVVLMGHFRTSIVHSKMISVALCDPQTEKILSEEEKAYIKAHIPSTYRLKSGYFPQSALESAIENKDEWIIKPEDDFGSHGVFSGLDASKEEWEELLSKSIDKGNILQRFCPRYDFDLLSPTANSIERIPLMLGAYTSCGKVVGFYSRAGKAGVIDFDHGGICVTTVKVN